MANEVIEGKGVLEVVKSDVSAKGRAYYKIKIGETWGNLWEYKAGKKLEEDKLVGQQVKFYAEKNIVNGKEFTNFKSIFKEEVKEEQVGEIQDESKRQQIKVISANSEKDFEEAINLFMKDHNVFATQFYPVAYEGFQKLYAVIYFRQ